MRRILTAIIIAIGLSHANSSNSATVAPDICAPSVRLDHANINHFTEEIMECKKGQILRIFISKKYADPAYMASAYCDFEKQIIVGDNVANDDFYTLACVFRGNLFY